MEQGDTLRSAHSVNYNVGLAVCFKLLLYVSLYVSTQFARGLVLHLLVQGSQEVLVLSGAYESVEGNRDLLEISHLALQVVNFLAKLGFRLLRRPYARDFLLLAELFSEMRHL